MESKLRSVEKRSKALHAEETGLAKAFPDRHYLIESPSKETSDSRFLLVGEVTRVTIGFWLSLNQRRIRESENQRIRCLCLRTAKSKWGAKIRRHGTTKD